jgi:predicted small secreted protein
VLSAKVASSRSVIGNPEVWTMSINMVWATLALVLMGSSVSACNTTEGFGEDMQSAGEAIEDTAEDAHD